jgi:hypothetical protein
MPPPAGLEGGVGVLQVHAWERAIDRVRGVVGIEADVAGLPKLGGNAPIGVAAPGAGVEAHACGQCSQSVLGLWRPDYLAHDGQRLQDTSTTLGQLIGPHPHAAHFSLVEEITAGSVR